MSEMITLTVPLPFHPLLAVGVAMLVGLALVRVIIRLVDMFL